MHEMCLHLMQHMAGPCSGLAPASFWDAQREPTPYEWNPGDRLAQLQPYLPDLSGLVSAPDAQELTNVAFEACVALLFLLLCMGDGSCPSVSCQMRYSL